MQIGENSMKDALVAALIFVGIFVVLRLCVRCVVKKLRSVVRKTELRFDDAFVDIIAGIRAPVYAVAALYVAMKYVTAPPVVTKVISAIFIITVVIEMIRVLQKILMLFIENVWLKDADGSQQVSSLLGLLIKIVLWSIGLLLVLSNLGVNVTSLVASMGIGGIAVALAVQNVLGDMFSSFSIYFDQPFKVGDFIIVGDHMGTVKKIGLKTTRIQALQGEEIVISNNELTSSRVRNFKKMQKRRIVFHFGVTYDTPAATLRKIPEFVSDILNSVENADLDRVHFKEFADSHLTFEVVYFVMTGNYNEYMDIQQEINLGLVERFEKEGIEFAFPTRTVHLVKSS